MNLSLKRIISSNLTIYLSLFALFLYIMAAFSGPMFLSQGFIHSSYPPFEYRWITYLGLTNPLSSFFFWAFLSIPVSGLTIRCIEAKSIKNFLYVIALLFIFIGLASLHPSIADGSNDSYQVHLKDIGDAELSPGQVYQLQANNQAALVGLVKASGLPWIVQKSASNLSIFIPTSKKTDSFLLACNSRINLLNNYGLLLTLIGLLFLAGGIVVEHHE